MKTNSPLSRASLEVLAARTGVTLSGPAPLRCIELEEICPGGLGSDARRYKVNGKRVERSEFDAVKRSAVRLECLTQGNQNGVVTFYSTARVA